MNATTAIRVISLASASSRRASFTLDAEKTQLEWSFFDALREPEAPLHHDPEATIMHTGRPLNAGELGCYASHYSLWCWFLTTDKDQLVVLEDDVTVDWAALGFLCKNDLANQGMHIVKLFATHPIKSTIVRYKLYSDHSHLLRLSGYCYGTQAYILTRTGAAALVKSCERLSMPIDWAMSRYWDYKVTNYAVFPYPIIERWGSSMIGHHTPSPYRSTRTLRYQRWLWRIRERIKRVFFNHKDSSSTFGKITDRTSNFFQ